MTEAEEAEAATALMSQFEIDQASDPDKGSIGEGIGNIIQALQSARAYVAFDVQNFKYPKAIETLAAIDAALSRSWPTTILKQKEAAPPSQGRRG